MTERITTTFGLAAGITVALLVIVGSIWAASHVAPGPAVIALFLTIWAVLIVVELASGE